MIPRIKSVKPLSSFFLEVVFDDGKKCIYDVEEDIKQIKRTAKYTGTISAGEVRHQSHLCVLE